MRGFESLAHRAGLEPATQRLTAVDAVAGKRKAQKAIANIDAKIASATP